MFGVSGTASFEAGVVIAKAETTFGMDYAYTSERTQGWTYQLSVPAGKVGMGRVFHRADADGFKITRRNEACEVTTDTDNVAYLPLNSEAPATYCITLDVSPYVSRWISGGCRSGV